MSEGTVAIMDGISNSTASLITLVRDPSTGKFFAPTAPSNMKEILKMEYLGKNSARREEDFEAAWPMPWKLKVFYSPGGYFNAIIDSGLMFEHPFLKDCIASEEEGSIDFTGEGLEDRIGHGTICALQIRIVTPNMPRFINVKVVSIDGNNSPENLARAFRHLINIKNKLRIETLTTNVSVGIYSKTWWGGECQGDCKFCREAIEAATQNITIIAAAGNIPGRTACPAKAGLLEKHPGIYAIANPTFSNSGIGSFMIPGITPFTSIDS